jgi:hypothetical protein
MGRLVPAWLAGRAARLAVTLLSGGAAIVLLWNVRRSGDALGRFAPAWAPLYFGIVGAVLVLRTLRWRAVLDRLGAPVPLRRLARYWLAGRAVGSLVPSGTLAGEPVRAALLVSTGIRRSTAAGAVALDRALELGGNMIAAPACLGGAFVLGAGSAVSVAVAAVLALAGFASFGFVYVRSARRRPALLTLLAPRRLGRFRWGRAMRPLVARVDRRLGEVIATHPTLVPRGVALSLVIECLQLGELAALFALFGVNVPLALLLLSATGVGVARIVPVSAALGSLEATQIGIYAAAGQGATVGLTVGLVLRLAETLWIVVGLACLGGTGRATTAAATGAPDPRAVETP